LANLVQVIVRKPRRQKVLRQITVSIQPFFKQMNINNYESESAVLAHVTVRHL